MVRYPAIVAVVILQLTIVAMSMAAPTKQDGRSSAPPSIEFGETKRGAVEGRAGKRSFTFTASRGDVLFLHLYDCDARGGSPLRWHPCLDLFDSTGSLIASSCEYNQTGIGGQELQSDGRYRIVVRDSGEKDYFTGGRFALYLQRVNKPSKAQSITPDVEKTAFLNSCGQIDTYQFHVEQGQQIVLSVVSVAKRAVYPRIELYDGAGRFVGEAQNYSPIGDVPPPGVIGVTAPTAGSYIVFVRNLFSDHFGAYRLTLKATPP